MAICLPGNASSTNLAETSDTRPAPLVMTIMLMISRMQNTNRPTAKLPPTRNWPKLSMISPAALPPSCPFTSTIRVEATFKASRSSVANSSTLGKDEKSSGARAFSATISTATAIAMLSTKKMSSISGGIGSTISTNRAKMPTGKAIAAGAERSLSSHEIGFDTVVFTGRELSVVHRHCAPAAPNARSGRCCHRRRRSGAGSTWVGEKWVGQCWPGRMR